jgi:hypothetical protein
MRQRIIGLALLALFLGCGDNELGLDKRRPNIPPETMLSSGPPDSTDNTVYKVRLFWSGTDRDGTVDHYDFILVDHPPIQDHIAGGPPDDPTRVAVTPPEPDDPRWIGSSATDSTFITLADTLRREAQPGPGETPDDVRHVPFERWHTFFVRAVDNEGTPDPTPDYRSFNSTNIAPRLWLLSPVKENQVFIGPPVIVFNWEGEDEVGDGTFKDPVASRWVNISSRVTVSGTPENGGYFSFPESLYTLPERYSWSEWHRWDAQDGSGKTAVVKGLFTVGQFPDAGYYIFAAQAMDEGGAITPVFDWKTAGKNNVALVRVSGAVGPNLTVQEEFLGRNNFVGGSNPVPIDVAAGQALNFTWNGDASQYGGRIVAYRFGWDLRDPDNDQEWDQNWCSTCTRSPTRSFTAGTHRFFVQVRDNAESITQAVFELTVHSVSLTRDLLWVDDSEFTTSDEPIEDARWLKVLTDLAATHGFSFDPAPNADYFDSVANRHEAPPIGLVFNYKVVVWTNLSGPTRTSALRNLCQFFDPFALRNRNTAKSFNYINLYLANKGKLWINGFRPAQKSLWPQERAADHTLDPVNVTQWDDPIEPHPPGVDSVGTVSLLYKMGVEMFDVGAGLDAKNRGGLDYYCQSLKRAVPPGSDRQVTESSEAESHTHHVTVLTQDVEAPPGGGVDYETDVVLNHKHTVHLSQAELVQLGQGSTVTVVSSTSDVPQSHAHSFDLFDQLGLWGAPILEKGGAWSQPSTQPNGLSGRSNIEIYNMPGEMSVQNPPLLPPPGISVVVYNYVSGPAVREDASVNRFYPLTADNQPVFILAKSSVRDQGYTRAFCGFEPYLLTERSHRALAEFVLVHHFHLGQVAN